MSINNLLIDSLKLRLKEKEEENLRLIQQINNLMQTRTTVPSNSTVILVSNLKNNMPPQQIVSSSYQPAKAITTRTQSTQISFQTITPSPVEPESDDVEPKRKRTRTRKPFFQVSEEQKRLNKKQVAGLVDKLNEEILCIGLAISSVTFVRKEYHETNEVKYEMNFINSSFQDIQQIEKNNIFKSTIAKDLANLSDRNYHLFRGTLNLPISNLHQIKKFKNELNSLFTIKSNSLGLSIFLFFFFLLSFLY
jgi:hypothetical protein